MYRLLKSFLLSANIIVLIDFSANSANAVQFSLTELQTSDTDGNTTNTPIFTGTEDYTPIGTNVVTGFEVDNSGSIISTTTWNALEVDAVGTTRVIQYKQNDTSCSPTGTPCIRLYDTDDKYLYQDGLSLSTGINKTTSQAQETFTFPVLNLTPSTIGDSNPDLISADIAINQSEDRWELLDSDGNLFAFLNTSSSDWNQLGTQQLERYDVTNDTVRAFNNRTVAGLALELSDFIVASTNQPLSSSDASNVSSLRILIEDPAEVPIEPKTDYAFFGADSNSIVLGTGVSSSVPFEFSPSLGLLLSGGGFFGMRFLKKRKRV